MGFGVSELLNICSRWEKGMFTEDGSSALSPITCPMHLSIWSLSYIVL